MVSIKEVLTKKDLKRFVLFPLSLYKDNPYYVPPLTIEEIDLFDPKKNPAYEFCETKLFLAIKNNKVVGRVAGLINHAYIKKVNRALIRFTRFDFIDDLEVSQALVEAVKVWGKENKMEAMMGPIGFTDIDKQGMLVEGFEEMNLSITIYNHPYYATHLEKLGFIKDADWVEYQIQVPESIDPRIERIAHLVEKRYGFHRIHIAKNKELTPYAWEAFRVINEAFAKLYGTVPLTDTIIEQKLKEYIPLVNLDYVIVIGDKNNRVIGFGLMLPSIAKALKKSKGRLFPLGIFRLMRALKKNDILEMYFIAVRPEFQNIGVNAIIMAEAIKAAIKNKVKFAESGPELETNISVQDQWKGFNARQHRRRRCYIKTL